MKNKRKTETIKEYLERGGSITICPPNKETDDIGVVRKTTVGPAVLMTLDEADLFYGKGKAKKKQSKASNSIDIDALPEALKNKFINKLREESNYGEDEEN
jgi:hypothetical protein